MHYVNVYKKHQLLSRSAVLFSAKNQRRRDSERLLHEPTTSDRFHASDTSADHNGRADPHFFGDFIRRTERSERFKSVFLGAF